GQNRSTDDFQMIHDEYRYAQRYGLMQDTSKETVTFRNNRDEKALPMRELGSFLLGSNVGGSGVHWNGQTWRFLPYDFEIKSMTEEKYGKNKLSDDYLIQDWGFKYDELEHYFYMFEDNTDICGVDNTNGSLRNKDYFTQLIIITTIYIRFL